MPKLSIIIPCYNAERYLDECVESVRAQTLTDWEMLLMDDGSTDNTPELCDRWVLEDPRIKVYHLTNGGPGAARNIGIEHATGDFLMFMDSDDILEGSRTLECALKEFESEDDLDIVQFPVMHFDGEYNSETICHYENYQDRLLRSREEFFDNLDVIRLNPHRGIFSGPVAKIFRNVLWKTHRFPTDFVIAEDSWVLCDMLSQDVRKVKIETTGAYGYRQQHESVTHRHYDMRYRRDLLKVYIKFGEMIKRHCNNTPRLLKLFAFVQRFCVQTYIEYGAESISSDTLCKIGRLYPTSNLTWKQTLKLCFIRLFGLHPLLLRSMKSMYTNSTDR